MIPVLSRDVASRVLRVPLLSATVLLGEQLHGETSVLQVESRPADPTITYPGNGKRARRRAVR